MAYTPTIWKDGQAPAINAENLNKMEQGIAAATQAAEDAIAVNFIGVAGGVTAGTTFTLIKPFVQNSFCSITVGWETSIVWVVSGAMATIYEHVLEKTGQFSINEYTFSFLSTTEVAFKTMKRITFGPGGVTVTPDTTTKCFFTLRNLV